MQCACAILSSVASPAVRYFSTLRHKRRDFRSDITEHEMCVLILSTVLAETFLILKRTERDIIIYIHTSSRKVPVIIVRFEWKLNLWTYFRKKNSNVISSENPSSWNRVVPCGQAYRQAGRRKDRCSDMKKLIVAFRNFADTSEKRQGLQYRSLNLFIAATFLSVCLSVYNHYHQWLPNSAELNQPQIRIANCLQL